MYAIYGNIYHQYTPNVSIYTSTMDPIGISSIKWCQLRRFLGHFLVAPLAPLCRARPVPRPILVPPSATWFVRTTPWRRFGSQSEIWDPLNPNLFGGWNHTPEMVKPIRKSGRLQWLGPQSFKTVEKCRRSSAPFFTQRIPKLTHTQMDEDRCWTFGCLCHLIAFVHCSGRCLFCKVDSTAMEYKFAWAEHQISSIFGVSNKTAVVDSSVAMFF